MTADHGDVFSWPRLYDATRRLASFGAARRIDRRAAALLAPYDPVALLDVGCGTGALTMALRERYPAAAVIGVDPGEAMLEHARRKAGARGLDIDYRLGHGQRLPVDDDAVDAVTMSLALHHVPEGDVPLVLAEMRRVLRPGGIAVVVELAPVGRLWRLLSPHAHDHQLDGYAAALGESGFTEVRTGRLTSRLLGYILGLAPSVDTASGDAPHHATDEPRSADTTP